MGKKKTATGGRRKRAGRPRENEPADAKERSRFMVNMTDEDRKRVEWLRVRVGLTHGADAVRWAARQQLGILQAMSQSDKEKLQKPDVVTAGELSPYQLWLNGRERQIISALRSGYMLDSDADAVRFAVREECKRQHGGAAA